MRRDERIALNAAKRLTDRELVREVERTEPRWATRHENSVTRANGLYCRALRAEAAFRNVLRGG